MPDVDPNLRHVMIDDLRTGRRPIQWTDLRPVPRRVAPEKQIRWGSYGDSIANIASTATQDLRTYTTGNLSLKHIRMGPWLGQLSGGLLRPVFNGGVSGDNTTQMLARESAGASSTRKAMWDAATCGVEYLVFSAGINDVQTLAAGASQASIDAMLATAYANLKILFGKARSLGITVIFPSLMPYSIGTAGENVTRNAAITQFNALLSQYFSDNPAIGYYLDIFTLLKSSSGGWATGYTDDGLHPNHNACAVYCAAIADLIIALHGGARYQFALPATPTASINCFDNADLSASTAGVATRFSISGTFAGTGTLSGQQIVRVGGVNFQEFQYTPSTFDVNGNAACSVDIVVPIFGATPYVAVANGDLLSAEADLYVDDGAGGSPEMYQYLFRFRLFGTVGLYMDAPAYDPTISPATRYTAPLNVHACSLPTTAGEASATLTNCTISCVFLSKVATKIRVRIGNIRVIKLPAGYA